jgi:hypothetical protein
MSSPEFVDIFKDGWVISNYYFPNLTDPRLKTSPFGDKVTIMCQVGRYGDFYEPLETGGTLNEILSAIRVFYFSSITEQMKAKLDMDNDMDNDMFNYKKNAIKKKNAKVHELMGDCMWFEGFRRSEQSEQSDNIYYLVLGS